MATATTTNRSDLAAPWKGGLQSAFHAPILDVVAWCLVAGCCFFNLANLLVDKNEVGLDFQVLIKLGLIGAGGLYGLHGFLTRRRVREILFSFPVAWILIIAFFYFVAVPFSPFPRNALVSSCSIIAVLLLMITALDHLGTAKVVNALFWGLTAFIVGSWFVYLAVPEIGVLKEPIPNGEFAYRMSGLAHANTLGQVSGLTVLFASVLVFSYRRRDPLIIVVGLLALAALVNSFSRTSLIACIASILVAYRHVYLKKEFTFYFLCGGLCLILGLLVASTQVNLGEKVVDKLEMFSKSGDADELTTATGRSEIWAHAIYLLGDRPITGYGAATQKYYLEDHSLYTHNLVLNVAFSAGIFAGIAAVLMLLHRFRLLFIQTFPLADAIAVFIIVNGLFENVIFSILAGMPTMLWILCLAWPLVEEDQPNENKNSGSRFLNLETP